MDKDLEKSKAFHMSTTSWAFLLWPALSCPAESGLCGTLPGRVCGETHCWWGRPPMLCLGSVIHRQTWESQLYFLLVGIPL